MVDTERIKVLLVLAGRDQRDLARAAGISPAMLSRALRGQRRLSVATRRRIVEELVDACLTA